MVVRVLLRFLLLVLRFRLLMLLLRQSGPTQTGSLELPCSLWADGAGSNTPPRLRGAARAAGRGPCRDPDWLSPQKTCCHVSR